MCKLGYKDSIQKYGLFLLIKRAYEAYRTVQNCKTHFVLIAVEMQTLSDFYLFGDCIDFGWADLQAPTNNEYVLKQTQNGQSISNRYADNH